uniref:Integrase, catalytic region, zinc finger, CCHC-type, peptidase aspartic, catalytic n=1 Tax=Tanacetum cinerariifolium TaxID=118510 RepID=A0A699LA87_TANCI|nr:integrase, catalytic region, zinc finger, CCHC-type, peptidase aspartic, catalytic [Tanacetum cinerariifolium]
MDKVDLLQGSRSTNLYTISFNDMISASPVCLLTKASSTKLWLWHRRLNHLNFGTLNDLARNNLVRGLPLLKYNKDHLCPSCQLESLNKKKYIMVIVDDYTRFGGVRFLRTKDETPKVFEKFLKNVQLALNTTVRTVRTDNGTEFVNKTLTDLFEKDIGKLKAKADIGIFVGYSPTKKAYRVYNSRTRKIQETVHVTFDELSGEMTSEHISSGLAHNPQALVQHSSGPELKALQSGRTRSALVKDTIIPSVLPTLPQLNELFQPFQRRIDDDEDFIPAQQVLILVNDALAIQNPVVIPVQHSSTNVSAGAPAVTVNSSVNESSDVDTNAEEASSSNTIEPNEIPSTPLPHVQKWTKDHPLENVIGDAYAHVSTRK